MDAQTIKHAQIFIVDDDPRTLIDLILNSAKYQLHRGDMIVMGEKSGYRSEGLYFFDGKKLIDQDRSYDDYGTVPAEFQTITEFYPGYWDISDGDMTDGDMTAKKPKFNVWKCSYNEELVIEPVDVTDSKVYWHSGIGISVLYTGPDYKIKVLGSEKITGREDLYVNTLSYAGEKYLFIGNSIDSTINMKTHVHCIIDMATGHVVDITLLHLLYALIKYKIPPERILMAPGL